jgi:hypothetical protein
VNASDVLAGENWMTPAPTTWSMNWSDTPDEAAPMMAETPSPSRRGISVSYALLSVLPESP